jgi:hypothetical protein
MSSWGSDPTAWIELAQKWLREAADGAHGGLDTGAPECGACPLCRAAGLLRSADPAVVATVVEAAVGAATAAAEVLREAGERLLATDPESVRPESPGDVPAADPSVGSDEAGEARPAAS